MEFHGGHNATILKYGILQILPDNIEMVPGPGCPVCVTANADLDKVIALAQVPCVITTTFADMIKVHGSQSSLQEAKAAGADVRIVYSTLDALQIAKDNSDKSVVFLGIGFEATAPTVAASIIEAREKNIKNYYVFSTHKVCPPAIRAILDAGEVTPEGLICPGHVSAVTGARAWDFVARDYGIPCVVSGFEPLDILQCVDMLVNQIEKGHSVVEIAYRRGVRWEGNRQALKMMDEVFEPAPALWRGLGEVPDSGLKIRYKYHDFDAERAFDVKPVPACEPIDCLCGDALRPHRLPVVNRLTRLSSLIAALRCNPVTLVNSSSILLFSSFDAL